MSGLNLATVRSYKSRFRWAERALAYDRALEERGEVLGAPMPPSAVHSRAYRQIAEDGFRLVLDAWRQIQKDGMTEIPFHQIWNVASGAAANFVEAVAAAEGDLDGTEVLDESNCTVEELRLISKLTEPGKSNGG